MTQRLDNFAKGGAWHQTIFQPFAEAGRKHSDLAKQVQQPLTNMLRNMPKQMRKNLGKKIHVEALGRTMRRSQLVMIALNAGNASNLGKMVRGSEMDGGAQPWTEEGVREALGLLTPRRVWCVPAEDRADRRNDRRRSPSGWLLPHEVPQRSERSPAEGRTGGHAGTAAALDRVRWLH
jgi:hypothetical protein